MNIQGKVWGDTSQLFNKNNVEIHFVRIKKGGFCSLHCHNYKFNHFVVISGKLKITIVKDYGNGSLEDISIINENQECTVHPGDYHKFEALEDTIALEIYWVYLDANDIHRRDIGGIKNETQKNSSYDTDRNPLSNTVSSHREPYSCDQIPETSRNFEEHFKRIRDKKIPGSLYEDAICPIRYAHDSRQECIVPHSTK